MTVHLIDIGLQQEGSHHLPYARFIVEGATSRGETSRVIVPRSVQPEISAQLAGVEPWLGDHAYKFAEDVGEIRTSGRSLRSERLAAEFAASLAGRVVAGDTVVISTATFPQLLAIATWLRHAETPPVRVRIVIHFPPGYSLVDADAAVSEAAYRRGLQLLSRLDRHDIRLFAEDADLVDMLSSYSDAPVFLLPMPARFPESELPRRGADGNIILGYFGSGRGEKGFELLMTAMPRIHARQPAVRFLLQVPGLQLHAGTGGDDIAGLCRVIAKPLSQEMLFREMTAVDAVVLPYRPRFYRSRLSSLLIEASALGVPVIVSQASGLTSAIERVGAGGAVIMNQYSSKALADAVDRFVAEREPLAAAARLGAYRWREAHAIETYHSLLFD